MKLSLPLVFLCVSLTSFAQNGTEAVEPNDSAKLLGRDFYYKPGVGLIFSPSEAGAAVASQATRYGEIETSTLAESSVPYGDLYLQSYDTWRVGIRMQKTFQDIENASDPAEFEWSRTDGMEDYQVDGAAMLDFYFAKDSPLGYDAKGKSLRFTVGAEYHKFTDGDFTADNQTYFALINITPALVKKGWRQPIQFGGSYTIDNLTDQESWGLILNYQPVIGVIGKWYGLQDRLRGLGTRFEALRKRANTPEDKRIFSNADKTALAEGVNAVGDLSNPKATPATEYRFDPFVGLNLADGSPVTSLEDASDAFARYGVSARLSLFHRRLVLGYSVTCNSAVSGGDTFVAQTAFADYYPRPRDTKSPLAIRFAWSSGESAPTFEEHEQVTLGLAIKL